MHEKHSFSIFGRDERPTCEAARPHLGALIDGSLSEQDAALLRMHVSGCPGCDREERALRTADRVLLAQEEVAVPARVWGAVEEKLRAEGRIEGSGKHPVLAFGHRRRLRLLHPITLAALCSIAAGVGIAAGALIPGLVAAGAALGLVSGFLVADRGQAAVGVSLLVVGAGASLLSGPAGAGAFAAAAVPAFAGALLLRRKAG